MELSPNDKQKLLEFLGYGPADPGTIFVGIEEHSEGNLANLEIRARAFPANRGDKNDACRVLAADYAARGLDGTEYSKALEPGRVRVWTFVAKLSATLRGDDSAWKDEYRGLGTERGDTFLAEMYPLPKRNMSDWPDGYERLFGYRSAGRYYAGEWPRHASNESRRRDLLRGLISLEKTNTVVAYGYGSGGEFWDRFDTLLDPIPTVFNGERARWHTVLRHERGPRAQVGRQASGATVLRLGFPEARRTWTAVVEAEIPEIVDGVLAMRSMQAARVRG